MMGRLAGLLTTPSRGGSCVHRALGPRRCSRSAKTDIHEAKTDIHGLAESERRDGGQRERSAS
jgi:hypothetical protein